MYTYQMSEMLTEEVSKGVEIDGETTEYAFDLNEFLPPMNRAVSSMMRQWTNF